MTQFYVYTVRDQDPDKRTCVYVDAALIEKFAKHEYDPNKMEFSGIMVEAESPQAAHHVYNTFSGGEVAMVDEPECTAKQIAKQTKALEKLSDALKVAEQAAAKLATQALAQRISMDILALNEKFAQLALLVRKYSNESPNVSTEDLYKRIKKRYMGTLSQLPYEEQ
jgi:hypothetical protein